MTTLVATAVIAAILCGFLPVLVTKLIVRLYPRDDPRRRELVAELLVVPFAERLLWVGQAFALALTEGLPARWRQLRVKNDARNVRPNDAVLRVLDLSVSALLLLVLAPVLIVSAVLVKLDSGGPMFVLRRRVGRDGVEFYMITLRCMHMDARARLEAFFSGAGMAPPFEVEGRDPRLTRVGRMLQATSLDELPKLWNVVRGDLSLVGPRPTLPSEIAKTSGDFSDCHRVRPGLLGPWQNAAPSDMTDDARKRRDLQWVSNRSIRAYVRILVLTVVAVFTPRRRRSRK